MGQVIIPGPTDAQSGMAFLLVRTAAWLASRACLTQPRASLIEKQIRIVFFLLILQTVSIGHAADFDGLAITRISHHPQTIGERQLSEADLSKIISLRVGEPYSLRKIGESIERLYATGRYADIQASAEPAEGGMAVTFITAGQYFAGTVSVRGVAAPPSETQLRVAAGLELGTPVNEQAFQQASERMKSLLLDQGYFQPEITWSEERDTSSQQSSVDFTINSGERARLGQVSLEGTAIYSLERILKKADWKVGERVDGEKLQRGLERLREMYHEAGYLQATVEVPKREFHEGTNQVDWVLSISAGMQVEIELTGAELSRSKLRNLIPIFHEGSLDEDLLREGEANLRTYFESEGYFNVKVNAVKRQTSDDHVSIEYRIQPGERQRLVAIKINGNRYFRDAPILDQMQIETPRTLSRFGRFSRQMLDSDVIRIRSLYVENGFSQAKVDAALQPAAAGNQSDIEVLVDIQEGPQTLIGDFAIEGTKAFSEAQLRGVINADSGQPFSNSMVTSDGNTILTFYLNEGYPEASFRSETVADGQQMNLKYIIQEGDPSYVANIFVGDMKYTRRGIVSRQIQFRPGEPVSQGRLLDTQRRLYDLGIFSRVEIGVQNPEGTTQDKNILVYLEEARRYTVKLGLGAEIGRFGGAGAEGQTEFSPDVTLSVSRLNFLGRPHTVGLRARFSALQRQAGLNYTAPRLFNAPWLTGTLLAFYDQTRDVKTFSARRWEGTLQFEAHKSRITTLLWRYTFRRVSVDENSLQISPEQIPLVSQPVLVGMAGLTWLRDTRDSTGSPTRGVFYSLDLAVAAKQFASEASFVRGLIQHSTYHRLPAGFTFVRFTQFGAQTPFGKLRRFVVPGVEMSENSQELMTRAIPIAERFFAGGGSTHRGFGLNQAGPRDLITGFAVGGNALLLNTFELRHSIWQNLVGVMFHDMGNVFSSVRDLSLSVRQSQPSDFDILTHAVGMGLRYETAVAPIRFDVGYTLNPTRYPVVDSGASEIRSLSRWQFLFSVGQTF